MGAMINWWRYWNCLAIKNSGESTGIRRGRRSSLATWWIVGRDPPRGPLYPVYAPTLPPHAMRFLEHRRFDSRCLVAAIMSICAKGNAVLVDDPDVFVDLVAWLGGLLAARGVPGSVFERSLAVMVETIPDDLPVTRSIVELGHSQLVA